MAKTKLITEITANLNKYSLKPGASFLVNDVTFKFEDVYYNNVCIGCLQNGATAYAKNSNSLRKNPSLLTTLPSVKTITAHKKDAYFATEQARVIKVPFRGNLDKILKKAQKNKIRDASKLVEYLCLVSEKEKSTEILRLLIRQGVVGWSFIYNLVIIHNRDYHGVMNYERIVKKIVAAVDNEQYLTNVFNLHNSYAKASGFNSNHKAQVLIKAVIQNPVVSTQVLEEILFDEKPLFDLLKFSALNVLKTREEYEGIPKAFLLRMFQLN